MTNSPGPINGNPAAPSAHDWLQTQAMLDWASAGLPRFADWDQALVTVMRLIAHSTAPMALMIGRDGILATNDSAQRLLAEKVGAPINGRSVLEVLPDSAPFYAAVLERVLSGECLSFRDQALRLIIQGNPQTSWFNLDFMPVLNIDGRILAVLGIASDVTQHVNRNRSLSDSVQRLRLGLEGAGMVGIWTLDIARNISTADTSVARIFGLQELDCDNGVASSLFFEAIHIEDRERVRVELDRAIRTGTTYRCRYRIVAHDDRLRWVIASAGPSYDDAGEVRRLLGVIVDVTDQMEAASALAESRFQFQTLTETLPQIVWSCDAEGRHDYFSRRWSEFTGIDPKDITEDTWKQLVYPEHWPMVSRVWNKSRRTGEPYDIDYRFLHRSGEYRWLRVMALPIRDGKGKITRWFGTSTDVHDVYLASEERERLAQELERIATEDQLTGVLTRRAFVERANMFIQSSKENIRQAALMMIDVDHFKSINDTYGHISGDRVLAITAERVRAALKKQDLVGRMGGEEFAIFLLDSSEHQTQRAAERIRRTVEKEPITLDDGRSVSVTMSIGVTTSSISGYDLNNMISSADSALYRAKSNGRNMVVFEEN